MFIHDRRQGLQRPVPTAKVHHSLLNRVHCVSGHPHLWSCNWHVLGTSLPLRYWPAPALGSMDKQVQI